ncbi:multidrug ABC transporter [Butyrivibrio sp. DSM 10294]|uniref:multidrug ABC transporter n=1 Tax=Butyrivibrio sp. DSM 10294 TaxID=2972457 RepID=UPI00234ED531|nr:multidrug ABC transporter [Butyrivibrio sp. DSM 10294]MDC7293659.1 multidrug ABC transporter [Butyrivibrio sp. DSM 10294]
MNVFFLLMILAELIASTSQILLKKSAEKEYPSFIREYLNVLVIGGYGMLMISMIISIFCYDGLGYMGVVVMEPLGYIIVMFLSRLVFKEKFTIRKLIGMVLILGGIAVFYGLG